MGKRSRIRKSITTDKISKKKLKKERWLAEKKERKRRVKLRSLLVVTEGGYKLKIKPRSERPNFSLIQGGKNAHDR